MKNNIITDNDNCIIITAGSAYLDIDAYACCAAMAELLRLKGVDAVAYSTASYNYSVCKSLIQKGHITNAIPSNFCAETAKYIIADVSDPKYFEKGVSPEQVIQIFDHHAGFEEYWRKRIGNNAHIEFIGAAATLIYREWKKAGLVDKMTGDTVKLLVAAVLDNTLNLAASVTTPEDIETFNELCSKENIDEKWCASYFSQVQANIEADLKNALLSDIKVIRDNDVLPSHIGQIAVWDAKCVLDKLQEIRKWFGVQQNDWMINIIDIHRRCSYFVCSGNEYYKKIEKTFKVRFDSGIAKSPVPYLRKELIKKSMFKPKFCDFTGFRN